MEIEGEDFPEEEFEESVDEDYDDEAAEELFRENPLKALWIRLGEIKELLQEND